jgi:hypothetical protein
MAERKICSCLFPLAASVAVIVIIIEFRGKEVKPVTICKVVYGSRPSKRIALSSIILKIKAHPSSISTEDENQKVWDY